jgi:hypothetical protein
MSTVATVHFFKNENIVIADVLTENKEIATGFLEFQLTDKDYQSLIETLEKFWPGWFDFDQWLAKIEMRRVY